MEVNVAISLRCQDKAQRNFVSMMLGDSLNKPILEDDVPESRRAWFRVLDEIDPPDTRRREGETGLHLTYMMGGYSWDDNLEEMMQQLAYLGLERVAAAVTSEFEEGELWLMEQGQIVRYESWQGKPVSGLLRRGRRSLARSLDAIIESGTDEA